MCLCACVCVCVCVCVFVTCRLSSDSVSPIDRGRCGSDSWNKQADNKLHFLYLGTGKNYNIALNRWALNVLTVHLTVRQTENPTLTLTPWTCWQVGGEMGSNLGRPAPCLCLSTQTMLSLVSIGRASEYFTTPPNPLNLEVDMGQYSRRPRSAGGCCWSSPVGFWSLEWPVSPQKCPSCPPEVSLKTQTNNRKLWQERWNQDSIRPGPEQTLSTDQHLFDLKLYIIRNRSVTEETKEIRRLIKCCKS